MSASKSQLKLLVDVIESTEGKPSVYAGLV